MKYMIKKSHIKLLLFFLNFHFLATFFLSCSQVTPEVISPEYSVIFEYEDEKSNPKARMSIFVESLTDVNRYERIRVYCENGGYIWDFNEIATFTNKNRSWTGNTNLKMPQNQIFPSGKYELIFYNADEKDTSVILNVNYDSSFYKLTSSESENLLKNKPATDEEEYKIECAALDVSKAFVYDLGYEEACKFARGILALGQIHDMR